MRNVFPKCYKAAQTMLNEMGNALREVNKKSVNTDHVYQGTSLCLRNRNRRKEGEQPGEWAKYHEIDPTMQEEVEETVVKM